MLQPLAKSALISLGLTAAASAAKSGIITTLIISNEEMEDIMKIVTSLEDYGLLIKGVNKTNQNEAKEQKGEFHGMLFGKLGAYYGI